VFYTDLKDYLPAIQKTMKRPFLLQFCKGLNFYATKTVQQQVQLTNNLHGSGQIVLANK